jgi:hypothetical protein
MILYTHDKQINVYQIWRNIMFENLFEEYQDDFDLDSSLESLEFDEIDLGDLE